MRRVAAGLAVALGIAVLVVPPASASGESVGRDRARDTVVPPTRPLVVGAFGTPAIAVVGTARDGELSAVPGSPYSTGPLSLALAITPDGRTVYSAHTLTGTIIGYRLLPDGTLSRLEGASVLAGGPVSGLAITPDGSRLFATVAGQLRSYAVAPTGVVTPTGAPPVESGGVSLISQVAITPDGQHVIVTNYLSHSVTVFAVGKGAELTRLSTYPTGAKPVMPAFTPDGRFLYISNESGDSVSGYRFAGDGTLMPTPGSPYATPSTPHGVAIVPDGRRLYVPSGGTDAAGDNSVSGFAIGRDGALSGLPGSPVDVSGAVGRVVISPDARWMYVVEGVGDVIGAPAPPGQLPPVPTRSSRAAATRTDQALAGNPLTTQVHSYRIERDGSFAPSGAPSVDTGLLWHDGSAAFLAPNQGPVAAVRVVDRSGTSVTFSAAGSRDPDGRVARYRWFFGDGERATTRGPRVTHSYPTAGASSVRVVVVDDEGCSTEVVYMGTAATCSGGRRASAALR